MEDFNPVVQIGLKELTELQTMATSMKECLQFLLREPKEITPDMLVAALDLHDIQVVDNKVFPMPF